LTPAPHIPLIVDLHAEEAAILWLQRDRAVDAPHYNRKFLGRLDERLEANIDGLRVAGRAGWEIARAAFDRAPEPGEVFALAALGFGAGSGRGIGEVLDIVEADVSGGLRRAAVSALGWLDPGQLRGCVQPLLDDRRAAVRALGLGACAVHRADPGDRLGPFLRDAAPVAAEAAKLAGRLGRVDLMPDIAQALRRDDGPAFPAAEAAVLLGDRGRALDLLRHEALAPGKEAAFELAVLAMDPQDVRTWIGRLGPSAEMLAVRAAGLIGDAALVHWLIGRMDDPHLGRRAGESLSLITGADLAFLDLDGAVPAGAPEGPNDDPAHPDVDLDRDAELVWPDPAKVAAWWGECRSRFPDGPRHFLGLQRSESALEAGFATGFQRQRRAAALGLSCLRPGRALPNWRRRERAAGAAAPI
jgi:uncharacterized protein (TIGR02270 family)